MAISYVRSLPSTSILPSGETFETAAVTVGKLVNRSLLSPQQRHHLEHLAFNNAQVPESYDASLEEGYMLQTACGQGVASVHIDGHFWHVPGGLLAPESLRTQMIQWVRTLSQTEKKTIAVYNVSRESAVDFHHQGFVVNKFGEEAIIDLGDITWKGKQFEWVRRQENYCLRNGLRVVEIEDPDAQRQLALTLLEIMNADFQDRTFDKPLKLLEGQFDPYQMQRRRLFVALGEDGQRVEGFLACTPIQGGKAWAFENYRKRPDATRGTTAFLFKSAIDLIQAEGAEYVSLCLIPGKNVGDHTFSRTSKWITRVLTMWYHNLEFLFNVKGQDHFKSRFRPRYVDRYMCIAPNYSLSSFWSFLKVTGSLNPNYANLGRELKRAMLKKLVSR